MKKTVLIVEDEIALLKAIEIKIVREGVQSISTRSVKGALEILETHEKIDAIWLDHYLLGNEDGLDFAQIVKSTPRWSQIPLFVVSNTASPEKINAYSSLGVTRYYVKSENHLETIIRDIEVSIA